MDKREYFIKAMAAGCYRYKRWWLEAFCLTMPSDVTPEHPLALMRDPVNGYSFIDGATGEIHRIEGADPKQPLYAVREAVTAYPGNLVNVREAVRTTYGNMFLNQILLCHPFGDLFPYQVGEIQAGKLEKMVHAVWVDDKPDTPRNPKKVYTDQVLKFNEAALSLVGFSPVVVVSATAKTMTTDPRIPQIRAELLEKYKGQLHDPVIQATIEGELKKVDREWMRGDKGENFYIKSKSYDVTRKKQFLIQGAADGFGTSEFLTGSLQDGWTAEELPAMNNASRDGSYSRGFQTALGGEVTKFNHRIFQNTSIIEKDCGSKVGLSLVLEDDIARRFIGNNLITSKGLVELTDDNIAGYINKRVTMRYTTYCHSKGANFCATCSGARLAETPNAVSAHMAGVGSLFMLLFMKRMHGTVLRIVNLDFHASLT